MSPRYSVVIPAYRSGEWLGELVTRAAAALSGAGIDDFEIILVNDCSPDAVTWPAIEAAAAVEPRVVGIDLLFNVGQFRAVLCGMEAARGEFILTMDDDFQHPPEELPKLIAALEENPDALCVMGDYETRSQNVVRRLGSSMISRLLDRAYGKPKGIRTTSFRIMRRPLAEAVLAYRTARPQLGPLIVSITRRVANVKVRHEPRPHGGSNYSLFALIRATRDSVVHASTSPLRFLSSFGLLCAGGAFLVGVVYFLRWLTGGGGVPGYTSQVLLISFFGGMSLMGLGILGEYVARIISELTGPERYQISRRCGGGEDGHG